MIRIPEETRLQLLQRFKKATAADIDCIERSAWKWLVENVQPEALLPGCIPLQFEAIPILKVHAAFGNKHDRNAGTFGSWNLITGYRKF